MAIEGRGLAPTAAWAIGLVGKQAGRQVRGGFSDHALHSRNCTGHTADTPSNAPAPHPPRHRPRRPASPPPAPAPPPPPAGGGWAGAGAARAVFGPGPRGAFEG